MRIKILYLAACLMTIGLIAAAQALNKKQDGNNSFGSDPQANLGSSVTDPTMTRAPNAERVSSDSEDRASQDAPTTTDSRAPSSEQLEQSTLQSNTMTTTTELPQKQAKDGQK